MYMHVSSVYAVPKELNILSMYKQRALASFSLSFNCVLREVFNAG